MSCEARFCSDCACGLRGANVRRMRNAVALLTTLSLACVPLVAQDQQPAPPPVTAPEPAPPAATAPEPAPVAAPAPPAVVTLGEFAIRAASGLGIQPPQGGFTPESAAWSLVQKGIIVRPELATPLTEADAVEALTQLGFKIRTTTPSRVVSRDRFEILCGSFLTPVVTPAPNPAPVATPDGKQ